MSFSVWNKERLYFFSIKQFPIKNVASKKEKEKEKNYQNKIASEIPLMGAVTRDQEESKTGDLGKIFQ